MLTPAILEVFPGAWKEDRTVPISGRPPHSRQDSSSRNQDKMAGCMLAKKARDLARESKVGCLCAVEVSFSSLPFVHTNEWRGCRRDEPI